MRQSDRLNSHQPRNYCAQLKCQDRRQNDKIFLNPYKYNNKIDKFQVCPGQKPIYQELVKGHCLKPKKKKRSKAHAMPSQLSFVSSFPWTAA